jgi:hypothetical protein|tara:strand:+ start:214 stop:972 length:759 start_codon:yes stop_codon:yes gene_type:complete
METSDIDYLTICKSIDVLKAHAQYTFKQLGLSKDATEKLIEHARENAYVSHKAVSSIIGLNTSSARILLSSFSSCVNEIHQTRRMLRSVDKSSRLDEARYESQSNAYRAFGDAFPSAQIETKCQVGEEIAVRDLYNKWDTLVEGGASVSVPISWNKKIYEEGISVVQAGDGARFILDCKERKIARLNNDYIRCWAVRAVKRKHKVCSVENATVMKYNAGGEVVLSISDSFSKSESLIRRRIKDKALGVLMEL